MSAGPANQDRPLLVVIPVYKDLSATGQCIESVAASHLPENTEVLIIDDASPEPEVSEYCRSICERTGYTLRVNDSNLGFVASANRGLQHREDADVILLNSDTLVHADWASRMRRCAASDRRIGTVTPFSNNGTICSYPKFNCANPLPAQWTSDELDRVFASANSALYAEIPTAVGFCMLITRECLDATGIFDVERFGHGYGEECDFCQRASARGYSHAVAADVFVFHQGAASFSDSSDSRKQAADKVIAQIHPQYHAQVSEFIDRDPLQALRNRVDSLRIEERPEDCMRVLEEHESYRRQVTKTLKERLANSEALAEAYRLQVSEEREQRTISERLLQECRENFQTTDDALARAEQVVADLNHAVEELQQGIAELKKGVENEQRYAASLSEKIELMERSRSWRYTRWLRRGQ